MRLATVLLDHKPVISKRRNIHLDCVNDIIAGCKYLDKYPNYLGFEAMKPFWERGDSLFEKVNNLIHRFNVTRNVM